MHYENRFLGTFQGHSNSGETGEGGVGGVTPPKVQIIWIGRANHLDWQGNERF